MNEQSQQQNAPEEHPAEEGTGQPVGADESAGDGKFGPWIGIIVIIAVIALGGFYFWGSDLAGNVLPQDGMSANEIRNQPDPELESLQAQGSSDELAEIEADFNSTNFNSFDEDLRQIDGEIEG